MSLLTVFARWIAFVPISLAASFVTQVAGLVLFAIAFGDWWLTGVIGCLLSGVLGPIAGYSAGLMAAPNQNAFCRSLLLLPNWFWVLVAVSELISLIGLSPGEAESFLGLSDRFSNLLLYAGVLAGCWLVFLREDAQTQVEQEPEERHANRPFEWDRPLSPTKEPQP